MTSRVERARATAIGTAFEDEFDWDYVSPCGLCVRDAFTMATAWAAPLKQHVFLGFDHVRASFQIVPTYEWIEVWRHCTEDPATVGETTLLARAAYLVWCALAACGGYGASENPAFWRRVFDDMQRTPNKCDMCSAPSNTERDRRGITDEVRFFDGLAFPRVRLWVSANDAVLKERLVRLFCGLDECSSEPAQRIELELQGILTRLHPHVADCRRVKKVDLSLMIGLDTTRTIALLNAVHEAPGLNSPQFSICEVSGYSSLEQQGPVQMLANNEATTSSKNYLRSSEYKHSPQTISGRYFRWALRTESVIKCDGLRDLTIILASRNKILAACFSTLPHTQSLETLTFGGWGYYDSTMEDSDLAWLGYALFHPDTSLSTWRQFRIEDVPTDSSSEYLAMMAKGNNLHVALDHATIQVDKYYLATLRVGTVIYDKPLGNASEDTPRTGDNTMAEDDGSVGDVFRDTTDRGAPGPKSEVKDECTSTSDRNHLPTGVSETKATLDDTDFHGKARFVAYLHSHCRAADAEVEDDSEAEAEFIVTKEDPPRVVEELTTIARMDVCVNSTDVAALEKWVMVVVPGYGLGWVRRSSIVSIEARAPGRPRLTGLRLELEASKFPEEVLLTLLRLIGGSIEYLEWNHHRIQYAAFDAIVQACPQLDSLVVGNPRSSDKVMTWNFPPQVTQLCIRGGHRKYFKMLFPPNWFDRMHKLETLRIVAKTAARTCDLDKFVLPALRLLPRLRRVYWIDQYGNDDKALEGLSMSYARRRQLSRSYLGGKGYEAVLATPSQSTRGALLDVVRFYQHTAHPSPLAGLQGEAITLICEYVGTPILRELWATGRSLVRTDDYFGGFGDY